MKTSTVAPSGGGGAGPRSLRRHIVVPNSSASMKLYVSASSSGTAMGQAAQFAEASQRQPM